MGSWCGGFCIIRDFIGTLTISGTGNMKNWNSNSVTNWHGMRDRVKTVIIENGVTSIGDRAFYTCESLTSIEISESVTSIGDWAFYTCESLTGIEIPSNVTSIEENAFLWCTRLKYIEVEENNIMYKDEEGVLYTKDGKTLITYPAGRTKTLYRILNGTQFIDEWAFTGCYYLTNIEILEGMTSIGDNAFYKCESLTSIEIPSSVASIGQETFSYCESLNNIEVNENNTVYKDDNGVLYTKNGKEIIQYPGGKEHNEYKILQGATSIGNCAFEGCGSVTSIEIPSSVISIGSRAFAYCTGLTSIEIPSNVTSIGYDAFFKCEATRLIDSYNNIELPDILKRTQDENDLLYSKDGLNFINCVIDNNIIQVIDINKTAKLEVRGGQLKNFIYIISTNTWDISATENDNVIAVLSDDWTLTISGTGNMGKEVLSTTTVWKEMNDNVKTVIIEKGVTNIVESAFEFWENLSSIKISEGVTSIEDGAFYGCYSLTSIEIPSSVRNIGYGVFWYCRNLTNIEVDKNNTVYKDDNGVVYTKDGTKIITYPVGKKETQYSILKEVTVIVPFAFWGCGNLTNIELLEGVTDIGEYAFYGCYNLTSIEIPQSMINIGEGAFCWCENLTNIEIPKGVTNIGEHTFNWCDKLTIICNKGSIAEIYVKENEKNYIIMRKISPKTTIEEMRTIIESNIEYEIVNKDHEEVSLTAYTATGHKIIVNGNDVHTLIVTGDCTGDGKADIQDIFAINKHRLNNGKLINEYLLAGDANRDGKTNINDIFEINKYRLGIKEIL